MNERQKKYLYWVSQNIEPPYVKNGEMYHLNNKEFVQVLNKKYNGEVRSVESRREISQYGITYYTHYITIAVGVGAFEREIRYEEDAYGRWNISEGLEMRGITY
jgi:hypothetical protein